MAKKTDSRCSTCGAIVGPGCRFCSHFCKLTKINDELKSKVGRKSKKAKSVKKSKRKKKK